MSTKYLIAHICHTQREHEHITWWKPDHRGYTICIDKAGLYDEHEALKICRYGSCIAVPKSAADHEAKTTPYYRRSDGRLAKMYDGGPHRPVPNSRDAWMRLFLAQLPEACSPEKPTPITPSKSRAIYIDDLITAAIAKPEGGAA